MATGKFLHHFGKTVLNGILRKANRISSGRLLLYGRRLYSSFTSGLRWTEVQPYIYNAVRIKLEANGEYISTEQFNQTLQGTLFTSFFPSNV